MGRRETQRHNKGDKMKYWIESSYNYEDINKNYKEQIVVAVDYDDTMGTRTIATFPEDKNIRKELEYLINRINRDIKEKKIIGNFFETH